MGGEGGGPRLVIRFDNGKTLDIPLTAGRSLCAPGRVAEAWLDRALREDPFVQSIVALGAPVRLEAPYLKALRPRRLTFAWWAREWPEKRGEPVPAALRMFREDYRRLLGYELERAAWCMAVAVCGRLLAGDPSMAGRTGPAYSIEPVPLDLLQNEDMELQRDGAFRSVPRPGRPPPPSDLQVFGDLSLAVPGEGRAERPAVPAAYVPETPIPNEPGTG